MSSMRPKVVRRMSRNERFRRFPLFVSVLILVGLYTFLTPRQPSSVQEENPEDVLDLPPQDPYYLRFFRATVHKSTVVPIVSRRNFWGTYETLTFPNFNVFNPSLLSLPYHPNHKTSFAIITRNEFEWAWQDGEEIQPRSLVAGLLDVSNYTTGQSRWSPKQAPSLVVHSAQKLPKLVQSRETYYPGCWDAPGYWNIQGPEDGRIFWTHLGEPLLIYISVTPPVFEHCRVMYLVDFRSVYPSFERHLSDVANSVPVRFPETVPLLYKEQHGFTKNWAPFTDREGNIYFHTALIPQTIFKMELPPSTGKKLPTFNSSVEDISILEPVETDQRAPNCISIALGEFGHVPKLNPVEIHQSTPFLEVVLCTNALVVAGECDPNDPQNRVYIGLVHAVHKGNGDHYERHYERRLISLNSTAPFNYISISKPLMYLGLEQQQMVYTVSINFRKREAPLTGKDLAVGYLDDLLIISFGIWDQTSHFVEVEVQEVLRGHELCQDIVGAYDAARKVFEEGHKG